MSAISHINFKGDSLLSSEGKTNVAWFFFYFLLYFLVYGYAGLRLGMGVDEVVDSDGSQTGLYLANGRWGIALYRMVFGYGSCFGIACLASGFFLSVNLVLVTYIMKTTSAFFRFVAGCFYFSVLSFCHPSFQSDAVALGFLCCTLGMKCLIPPPCITSRYKGAIAVFLIAFGMGCYQTLAFYFIALWLVWQLRMYQLNASWSAKEVFRSMARFACIGGFAFAIYLAVYAMASRLPCVSPNQATFANEYQQRLNGWNTVAAFSFPEKLFYLRSMASVYIRNVLGLAYVGSWAYMSAVLPVCFLSVAWLRRFGAKKGILPVLLALSLWCLPFILILVMAYPVGSQTFTAESLSLAYLWILLLSEGNFFYRLHKALLVLMPFMVLKTAYIAAEGARLELKEYNKTVAEVRELAALIRSLELKTGSKAIVMGYPINNMCGGWSFLYYLNHLGLADRVRLGNEADAERHRSALECMADWPAYGCICEDQGEILIRLGAERK